MRDAASDLKQLLAVEFKSTSNDVHEEKAIKSSNLWIAIPADYLQFCRRANGQKTELDGEDGMYWKRALGNALAFGGAPLPPLPIYRDFPWAAYIGRKNPMNFDVIFNDRYFMASSELNLINTLLLASERTH